MTVLMVPNDIAIFFMAQRFKEIFEATPSNAVKITLGDMDSPAVKTCKNH